MSYDPKPQLEALLAERRTLKAQLEKDNRAMLDMKVKLKKLEDKEQVESNEVNLAKIRAMKEIAQTKLLETQEQAVKKKIAVEEKEADIKRQEQVVNLVFRITYAVGDFFKGVWETIPAHLARYGAAYVIVILIIVFLVYGATADGGRLNTGQSSKDRDAAFNKNKGIFRRIGDWFRGLMAKLSLGPRFKLIMQMMNPFGGRAPTTERPRVTSGRCDMATWYENGGDGVKGVCTKSYVPKDINWVMDTDKMSEARTVPQALYQKATNNGQKLQVSIPWQLQGTFYVPQCSKATFANGTSAANLFEDTGMGCKMKEVALQKHGNAFRSKASKDVSNIVSLKI